ncbi:MAG: hypothetical protein WBA57_09435 [Elainellaceae cyanobacterium]
MTNSLLLQIGNWNPQLLREIRGRLTTRSIFAVLTVVAIAHMLILLGVWQSFEGGAVNPWRGLFQIMAWLLPYGLYFIGGYSLVNDLTTEELQGTLNFVRLSPRPSPTILLGKLLGVPLLFYLAIALFVPLHLLSALIGGVPLGLVLSFYLMLVAEGLFIFCLAMLFALVSASQSMVKTQPSTASVSFAVLTLMSFTPTILLWNQVVLWSHFPNLQFYSDPSALQWFYFPIGQNIWMGHGFTLATLFVGTTLIWNVVKRRFENPGATLISKRQSYALVACLELLIVGFFIPGSQRAFSEGAIVGLYGLNMLLFIVLIFALSPTRQALLDWRYYESRQASRRSTLIWGERSPAPVAIAINLLIAGAVVVPFLFWVAAAGESLLSLLFVALGFCGQVLFYGVLSQRILAAKVKNPWAWAVGTLSLIIAVPMIVLGILSQSSVVTTFVWAVLGFQVILFAPETVSQLDTAILIVLSVAALAVQWIILGLLTWHLQHFLSRMGKHEEREAIV